MKLESFLELITFANMIAIVLLVSYSQENKQVVYDPNTHSIIRPYEVLIEQDDDSMDGGSNIVTMSKDLSENQKNGYINEFIISLNCSIQSKCQYGDYTERLSEPERVFYITQTLEMEVNNGGFDQYFFNSSGNQCNEIVDAFTKIKATNTVEICKKALGAFGCEVPSDRWKRQELLDHMECDEFTELLDECDDEFYEYKDDLNALNYEYVMEHKEAFGLK